MELDENKGTLSAPSLCQTPTSPYQQVSYKQNRNRVIREGKDWAIKGNGRWYMRWVGVIKEYCRQAWNPSLGEIHLTD